MVPAPGLVARFASDLDALTGGDARIGLAVSGGPDSLALLLLAAAARPGGIEAATVDHGLRPGSRDEADMVAGICERLGVPHTTLAIEWDVPPSSAVQEQARAMRYGALARWMRDSGIGAVATGHHRDDQAETLVMRLNRGAGVRGLAGMRPSAPLPGDPELLLLRPLLGWSRSGLEEVCAAAGIAPADDPSNRDQSFERVRVRRALAEADWLDAGAFARSAANLAAADEALDWAADEEWRQRVDEAGGGIRYRPGAAPAEIRRRVVKRALSRLASEGSGEEPKGRELDRLLHSLEEGRTATLRGVRCSGGREWRFSAAAPRRRT